VAQRAALGRPHQVDEDLALGHQTVFEFLGGGELDSVNALDRRRQILGRGFDHVACKLEVRSALRMLARQVAHQWQGRAIGMGGSHFAGQGLRLIHQAVRRLGHRVPQLLPRQHGQHFSLDGFATDDHVGGCFHANHARQSLRAAGARNQAQLDFGQCNAGTGCGNAVVAAQGQLQPSAHGHAVHGRDHRLLRVFTGTDDRQQVRLLKCLGRAEFLDVGATREGLARPGDDDSLDGRIVVGLLQPIGDTNAGGQTQAIDGRVHQSDHRHIAVDFVFSCHAGIPS